MKKDVLLLGGISKTLFYFAVFWFLIGFVFLPMLNTVFSSFETDNGMGFVNYIEFFKNPNSVQIVKQTFIMGLFTAIICGLIGSALAFYMTFVKVKNKKFLHAILLSPMMVPGLIIVIAFIQLYGESGIITKALQYIFNLSRVPYNFSGLSGILFVHACTQYTYFYLNTSIALKYVDYSTIEAAKGMGASKLKILFTIIIPSIAPALLSSAIVTFISGIGSFSAPNLIGGGYRVLSTQIVRSKANNFMNIASLQVVILLLMGLSVMMLIQHYEKKYTFESSVRNIPIEAKEIQNPALRCLLKILISVVVLVITLPIVGIIFLSFAKSGSMMTEIFPKEFTFDNYIKIFSASRVLKPFTNSITMSFITVIALLLITLPLSYFLAKNKTKCNSVVLFLAMLPWAMPVSTIGINLINSFNVKNIFSFNRSLIGTFWILPLAYIIISLPLMVRTNKIAMESFNISLEHASRSLGAGPVKTFLNVTAPVVMPAIISSAALVFIRTIGEYTCSALLYGIYNRPISIAMVTSMQEYDIELSMAYGTLTILVCFIAMFIIMKFDKEKLQ